MNEPPWPEVGLRRLFNLGEMGEPAVRIDWPFDGTVAVRAMTYWSCMYLKNPKKRRDRLCDVFPTW
jgi:hypothetical protein